MIAYGRLDNFSGGIAVASGHDGICAHNWAPDGAWIDLETGQTLRVWIADCKTVGYSNKTWPMLDRGDYPICKRCAKKMERAA